MKKSKHLIQTATLVLVAVFSMSVASATVTYIIGNGGLETFTGSIDDNSGDNLNGALAGGIQITEEGTPVAGLPDSYVTVCTDLGATLYLGQSYTYDAPVPFATEPGGVAPPWSNATESILNAAYIFYTYGQLTGAGLGGTSDQKTALQLAVWAALYDTTATGNVLSPFAATSGTRFTIDSSSINSTVLADVNSYLSGLNGSYSYLIGSLLFPDPLSGQNSVFGEDGEAPQELLIASVPEAPTAIASVLLLLPFAISTFKILRRKRGM